jgi:hypothetical protein
MRSKAYEAYLNSFDWYLKRYHAGATARFLAEAYHATTEASEYPQDGPP